MPGEYTLLRAERSLKSALFMVPPDNDLRTTLLTLHCPFSSILRQAQQHSPPGLALKNIIDFAEDTISLLRLPHNQQELDKRLSELNENAIELYFDLDRQAFFTAFEPCHKRDTLRSGVRDIFVCLGDPHHLPPAFLHPNSTALSTVFSSLHTFYDCLHSILSRPPSVHNIASSLVAFIANHPPPMSLPSPPASTKMAPVDVTRFSLLTAAISHYRASRSPQTPSAHASAIDSLLSLFWHVYDNDATSALTFDLTRSRVGFPTVLGSSKTSVVYVAKMAACVHKPQHPWHPSVAVKIFPTAINLPEREMYFRQEGLRLRTFDHPCLVAFHGMHWPEDVQNFTGDILAVTELLTHNLNTAAVLPEFHSMQVRLKVLLDISSALEYLHARRIAYRNLHPGNVLLAISRDGWHGHAKLDVSQFFKAALFSDYMHHTLMSLLIFMAPEELKGEGGFLTGDVYSFGVLICFLMSGEASKWELEQRATVGKKLMVKHMTLVAQSWSRSLKNQRLRELAMACLHIRPEKRPEATRVTGAIADVLKRVALDNAAKNDRMQAGVEQSEDVVLDSSVGGSQPLVDTDSDVSEDEVDALSSDAENGVDIVPDTRTRGGISGSKRRDFRERDLSKNRARGGNLSSQAPKRNVGSRESASARNELALLRDNVLKGTLGNSKRQLSGSAREQLREERCRGSGSRADPAIDIEFALATPMSNSSKRVKRRVSRHQNVSIEGDELLVPPEPGNRATVRQSISPDPRNRRISHLVPLPPDMQGPSKSRSETPVNPRRSGETSFVAKDALLIQPKSSDKSNIQNVPLPSGTPSPAPFVVNGEPDVYGSEASCEALNRSGERLLESGKPGCLEQAARMFKSAADAGNANAQINYGHCLEQGRGVERDYMLAAVYFQSAANQGHDKGQLKMGLCHEFGRGTKRDPKLAVDWYRKAADQGNLLAQANLAIALEQGRGVKKDVEKAASLYRNAAERGNTVAQLNLGALYESGRGVEKDELKAFHLYEAAAAQGNNCAMLNLGYCYERGVGVGKSKEKAAYNFLRGSEAGNVTAQFRMGQCYENGDGVKKNVAKAAQQYNMAARQGGLGAMCSLGILYEEGRGVSRDYAKAFKLYQAASNDGHPASTARLARCYENGIGIKKSPANAVSCYKLAAQNGCASAMVNLGYMYENGTGVKKSCESAVALYKKAAELGNPQGETALGQCYYYGYGMEKSISDAVMYYKRASDKNDVGACLELGNLYNAGIEIDQNYGEAFALYKKAAKAGNSQAQVSCGECFFYGRGVRQDYELAFEQFEKAADQQFAEGYRWLGDYYSDGSGVDIDLKQAVEYYRMGAEGGSSCAQTSLGCCYEKGQGVEPSGAKAVNLYRKAADNGSITAMNNLGILYEKGKFVKRDYGRAFRLYRKAVDMGNLEAICNLADCYMEGHGVPKSIPKAVELYQEAAAQGMPGAECELGACFYVGRGVEQNFSKAVELFRKALHSEPEAQRQLGIAYVDGCGVEKDYAKAMELFTESASAGNDDAYLNIGMCYEHGKGVEVDKKIAAENYRKAADGGNLTAKRMLGFFYFEGIGVDQNRNEAVKLFKDSTALSIDRVMH